MKKIFIKILLFINYITPKNKNKIVFISGPDYSDNSRALYEHMQKKNEYKNIWLVKNDEIFKQLKNRKIKVYKTKSIKGLILFFTSKYIVSNQNNLLSIKSRKQIYISLWHGMPLKNIHFLDDNIDIDSLKYNEKIDFTIATSKLMKLAMSSAFNIKASNVLITGQPRNDALLQKNDCLSRLIEIQKSDFDKIAFYLPTYRSGVGRNDGLMTNENLINLNRYDEIKLNEYLKLKKILLVVKLHPVEENKIEKKSYSNIKIIDSKEMNLQLVDLNQIISESDLLITDYSSVFFDYLIMNKPILFLDTDKNEYSKNRGFIFDNVEFWRPGPKVNNLESFICEVNNLLSDKKYFKKERDSINSLINTYYDDKSSERVYQKIFKNKTVL